MHDLLKKTICCAAALAIFVGTMPVLADETPKTVTTATASKTGTEEKIVSSVGEDYSDYLAEHSSDKVKDHGKDIVFQGKAPAKKSGSAKISSDVNHSGKGGIILPDDGFVSWDLTVAQDTFYSIYINYAAAEAGSGFLEMALKIDGKTPFRQAAIVSLTRTYKQDLEKKLTSISGDDMKPEVTEDLVWKESPVTDASGHILTPLTFFFSKGKHTLTFEGSRGKIAIGSVKLTTYEKPISYKEYSAGFGNDEAKNADSIVIEGEGFTTKSVVTILPKSDKTSPATTPQSARYLRLNTVGGANWKNTNEAVTWDLDVEKSGVYEIALRFRQNLKDGIFTTRKLYIDDKIPFAEAELLRFRYSSRWQSEKLGNDDGAFSFYLEKGHHTLTLEATAGEVARIAETVQKSVTEMNRIYRRIVMITGTSPDPNRDYSFEALIPEEIKQLKQIRNDLQDSVDYINKLAGINGSYVSIIQKLVFQLDQMTAKPRNIAKYLERFKSNLGAMSEWMLTAAEQPLEIDKITVLPAGSETPAADVNFFKRFGFSVSSFFNSYFTDYGSIGTADGGKDKQHLKVWVQTGRDQAEIIRDLINNSFAKEHNAVVTLEISSALLNSVLAGISPDVVLDNGETTPMEFALRNAVADLREFDDYEEVAKRFPAAALKPAEFGGKVYGLPQSFSFPMFFYRTDIFEEYGYKVPKTWKELCELIPSLQRNRLEAGVPNGMFSTFLYQNGGEFYRENGKSCNLDDPVTVETFADFMELFTLYDCPVTYNFANRFRSGEMPCAVADYSTYNQLTAFAPEIKGLWEMVPIPGTMDENGNINNVTIGGTSYMMMMRSSKNRDLAWEFMKWFMSEEIQTQYAYRMESILGTCAKVPTANLEALSKMAWSSKEYKNLAAQLEHVDAVPQVPGGYYLGRVTGFAFNRVYNNSEDPAETITDYVKELNDELTRKRAEFGLE